MMAPAAEVRARARADLLKGVRADGPGRGDGAVPVDDTRAWDRVRDRLGVYGGAPPSPTKRLLRVPLGGKVRRVVIVAGGGAVLALAMLLGGTFSDGHDANAAVINAVEALSREADVAANGGEMDELARHAAELRDLVAAHPDAFDEVEMEELQAVIATLERIVTQVEPDGDGDSVLLLLRPVLSDAEDSLYRRCFVMPQPSGAMPLVCSVPVSETPPPLVWEVSPPLPTTAQTSTYNAGPAGTIALRVSASIVELSDLSLEPGWAVVGDPVEEPQRIELRIQHDSERVTFRATIEDGRLRTETEYANNSSSAPQ